MKKLILATLLVLAAPQFALAEHYASEKAKVEPKTNKAPFDAQGFFEQLRRNGS